MTEQVAWCNLCPKEWLPKQPGVVCYRGDSVEKQGSNNPAKGTPLSGCTLRPLNT